MDLNAIVHSALTVSRSTHKYVADVVLDLAELPTIEAYRADLNQLMLNLIVNAAHAIEDAQPVRQTRGEIRITTTAEESGVRLQCSDTGVGIPEDIVSRVFDPFYTTKQVGRGTGQGLTLVLRVVERHGGRIQLESEVGQGTTFTIHLPFVPSPRIEGA